MTPDQHDQPRAAGLDDTCLAAVLPAGARRLHVHDAGQAARLAACGATITDDDADAAIGPAAWQRGAAPCAVVTLGPEPSSHEGGPRRVKAVRRILAAVGVRAAAARAARRLRRLGYDDVSVMAWDQGHKLPLSGDRRPGRSAELFPRRAVVTGRRGDGPSLIEQVVADAQRGAGLPIRIETTLARGGLIVGIGDDAVLRAAVGPAVSRIGEEARTLGLLRGFAPPPEVVDRLPLVLGAGTTGLASWLLESRVRGVPPRTPLSQAFLEDCVGFLAALHPLGAGDGGPSPSADAAEVADACDGDLAAVVRRLGGEADPVVAGLPRGFGHGDFWHANLLGDESGTRLTGVVDWDSAGTGRLPYVDLMHLVLNDRRPRGFDNWGPGVVEHLLPWARAGGDDLARRYGDALGLPRDPRTLEAVAVAYWLDFLAYQLRSYAHRRSQSVWMRVNVEAVARALSRR
jgi:aminoglycoside phosphotransferase (APT) family kinase protein